MFIPVFLDLVSRLKEHLLADQDLLTVYEGDLIPLDGFNLGKVDHLCTVASVELILREELFHIGDLFMSGQHVVTGGYIYIPCGTLHVEYI